MQQFAWLLHRETGVTDTGSWIWLMTSAPHSGSWGDVLGAIGVCLLTLAVLLPVGDWAQRTGTSPMERYSHGTVLAASATGTMVLSVYAAHLIVMWLITAVTGYSFSPAQPVWVLIAFTVGLGVWSALWMRRYSRGPLEMLLAWTTARITRA